MDSLLKTVPLAELKDVTLSFPNNNTTVLSNLNWIIQSGESWLILGASGSGKSSILQLIIGLIPQVIPAVLAGEVVTMGVNNSLKSVVDISRHVGWLNQDPFTSVCLPFVEQEIALVLENKGIQPEEIDARIAKCLSLVGLQHLTKWHTSTLSGGELQRVALAAILAGDPELILLDEPTSMLDSVSVKYVQDILRHYSSDNRKSVVLVEHRLDELINQGNGLTGLPENILVLGSQGETITKGNTHEKLVESAQILHQKGIWLPLEIELYALTGFLGGLATLENSNYIAHLANQIDLETRQSISQVYHQHYTTKKSVNTIEGITEQQKRVSLRVDRLSFSRNRQVLGGDFEIDVNHHQDLILNELSFSAFEGERIAIMGKNGEGKTTLLLALAGLHAKSPDTTQTGVIESSSIGMVFQNPEYQFITHTVIDEINYGLDEIDNSIAESALASFRLSHCAKQNPFKLSGGEKRRLSVLAMTRHDRDVLLADEPTLGLDRKDTFAIMSQFNKLADNHKTVIFTSHDIRLITTYSTRLLILDKGRIVADDTPYKIFRDESLCKHLEINRPELITYIVTHFSEAEVKRILLALEISIYDENV